MIENKVTTISSTELNSVLDKAKTDGCFVVVLDGKAIQSEKQFLDTMGEKYKMPDYESWEAVIDWIIDLSWIDNECYALVIDNYADFLKEDLDTRKIAMEIFEEDVLPFWEEEVVKVMVDGERRSFNIYLVE